MGLTFWGIYWENDFSKIINLIKIDKFIFMFTYIISKKNSYYIFQFKNNWFTELFCIYLYFETYYLLYFILFLLLYQCHIIVLKILTLFFLFIFTISFLCNKCYLYSIFFKIIHKFIWVQYIIVGRILTMVLVSLMAMGLTLQLYLFFLESTSALYVFLDKCPFLLRLQICEYKCFIIPEMILNSLL